MLAAVSVCGVALASCSAEPTQYNPASSVASEQPTNSAETAPPAKTTSPTIIPGCDSANPLALQESKEFFDSSSYEVTEETGPTDMTVFDRLAGPIAKSAMTSSADVQACQWPLYIAGNRVTQYTSRLHDSARSTFLQGLRDSDFVETEINQALIFSYSMDDPESYRMTGPTTIQHVFIADVWVAIFETGKSGYSQSALDALHSLNPELAGQ